MSSCFHLLIHGIGVTVSCEASRFEQILANLSEDFRYFDAPTLAQAPDIELVLSPERPRPTFALPAFKTRMCRVLGLHGRLRICDYGSELWIHARNSAKRRAFRVFSPRAASLDETYEVAYTTLLSAIGEALDHAGYHRIHALGIERGGEGILYVLPSGGGKSSLCASVLADESVRILSDEMPLLKDGMIHPFPVRIALKPEDARRLLPGQEGRAFRRRLFATKLLFPIPATRVSGPVRISRIYLPRNGWLTLFRSLVIGEGLAQMSEHMLRLGSIFRLSAIAYSRLRTFLGIRFGSSGVELCRLEGRYAPAEISESARGKSTGSVTELG